MNEERRNKLKKIAKKLESLLNDLEQVKDDEEDAFNRRIAEGYRRMMEFNGINMNPRNEDADRLKGRECTEQELQEIQIKRAMDEFIKQIERITGKTVENISFKIALKLKEKTTDRKWSE